MQSDERRLRRERWWRDERASAVQACVEHAPPDGGEPSCTCGATLSLQSPGLAIGLGGRLWPSSAALCRWLLSGEDLQQKHALELGCGCGAVGLYAAALGCNVLLTDGGGDALLQVVAGNKGRNHRLLGESSVEVCAHRWGEDDLVLPPQLDFVFGADVTYALNSHDALCRSIRWLVDERAPRCVLAHEHRYLTPAARKALGRELPSAHDDGGDDALINFCETAATHGLAVSTVCRETQAGLVTVPEDASLPWTEHLVVRGEAISILSVTAH